MPAADDSASEPSVQFSRDRARRAAVARIAEVVQQHKGHGTSVRAFARHAGMHWKSVDKLLKGEGNPPLETLLQLAHALDLRSVEELLGPFGSTQVLNVGRGPEPDS